MRPPYIAWGRYVQAALRTPVSTEVLCHDIDRHRPGECGASYFTGPEYRCPCERCVVSECGSCGEVWTISGDCKHADQVWDWCVREGMVLTYTRSGPR